jgi:hypothetical protein
MVGLRVEARIVTAVVSWPKRDQFKASDVLV